MANILDELLERGYIKQFTHEDETRELLEKEKITFYKSSITQKRK